MKSESYQQFAIVAADSAQLLTEQLNAKLYDLRKKKPAVTFEGLIARISWFETETEAESIAEEYAIKGVSLVCGDCPFFEPTIKADGTEDKRTKTGACQYAEFGYTYKTTPACDRLFEMINSKEVRLCLEK